MRVKGLPATAYGSLRDVGTSKLKNAIDINVRIEDRQEENGGKYALRRSRCSRG